MKAFFDIPAAVVSRLSSDTILLHHHSKKRKLIKNTVRHCIVCFTFFLRLLVKIKELCNKNISHLLLWRCCGTLVILTEKIQVDFLCVGLTAPGIVPVLDLLK